MFRQHVIRAGVSKVSAEVTDVVEVVDAVEVADDVALVAKEAPNALDRGFDTLDLPL